MLVVKPGGQAADFYVAQREGRVLGGFYVSGK